MVLGKTANLRRILWVGGTINFLIALVVFIAFGSTPDPTPVKQITLVISEPVKEIPRLYFMDSWGEISDVDLTAEGVISPATAPDIIYDVTFTGSFDPTGSHNGPGRFELYSNSLKDVVDNTGNTLNGDVDLDVINVPQAPENLHIQP